MNVKDLINISMIVSGFTGIVACATKSTVVVRSEPVNAKVYLVDAKSGQNALIGNTPLTFERELYAKKDSDILQIRLDKAGYESKYTAVASFGGEITFVDVDLPSILEGKKEVSEAFETSRVLLTEANRLVLSKRFPEALTRIEKILEVDPKNPEGHAAKGSVLYLMKDYEGAHGAWTKALELNPSFESVRSSLIDLNTQFKIRKPSSAEGRSYEKR